MYVKNLHLSNIIAIFVSDKEYNKKKAYSLSFMINE